MDQFCLLQFWSCCCWSTEGWWMVYHVYNLFASGSGWFMGKKNIPLFAGCWCTFMLCIGPHRGFCQHHHFGMFTDYNCHLLNEPPCGNPHYNFLCLFGSVHSWWCFPFQCLIGPLQWLTSNHKFGKVFLYITSYLYRHTDRNHYATHFHQSGQT